MPEVFAFKERVLTDRGARPGCERIVIPTDLREAWPAALRDTRFDPGKPTAWLIEGLLMYVDEGERDLLLDRVGALSSRGSRIALDHRPGFFSPPIVGTAAAARERSAARFAALAAAASSDASLTEPVEWLGRHGWRAEIEEPAAIFARHGRAVPAQLQPVKAGAPRSWMATAEGL